MILWLPLIYISTWHFYRNVKYIVILEENYQYKRIGRFVCNNVNLYEGYLCLQIFSLVLNDKPGLSGCTDG